MLQIVTIFIGLGSGPKDAFLRPCSSISSVQGGALVLIHMVALLLGSRVDAACTLQPCCIRSVHVSEQGVD